MTNKQLEKANIIDGKLCKYRQNISFLDTRKIDLLEIRINSNLFSFTKEHQKEILDFMEKICIIELRKLQQQLESL